MASASAHLRLGPGGSGPRRLAAYFLHPAHVDRLDTARGLLDAELNELTLVQRMNHAGLESTAMYEDVSPRRVSQKAPAAPGIIELDDASATAGSSDKADIIFGDNGEIVLTGGLVERIRTLDISETTGGNDTIEGNADADIVLGGVGADEVYGDAATPGPHGF